MASLPLEKNNVVYNDCLQQSIEDLEMLIKKEYRFSLQLEKLLLLASDKSCTKVITNIIDISKKRNETLKEIYLDITNRNCICACGPVHVSNNLKKDLIWAVLDKFQIIKVYNSLLENLTEAKHRSLVLKIINNEISHIGELNSLLIDK
jgi:rubrerythrin